MTVEEQGADVTIMLKITRMGIIFFMVLYLPSVVDLKYIVNALININKYFNDDLEESPYRLSQLDLNDMDFFVILCSI